MIGASVFSFATDGAGVPELAPLPVRFLRAAPLAGGKARVTWQYRQTESVTPATQFVVHAEPVDGGSGPGDITVPRVGAGERYSAEVSTLGDRLWRIYVYAESATGKSITAVTPVFLKADTSGPAVSDVVLEVA